MVKIGKCGKSGYNLNTWAVQPEIGTILLFALTVICAICCRVFKVTNLSIGAATGVFNG
jgi:hypothetical protein